MLVEAAVKGNAVGVDEQVLQGGHSLQAQRALHAVRQVRVVKDHAEAEGLGPQSYSLTHASWKAAWLTLRQTVKD